VETGDDDDEDDNEESEHDDHFKRNGRKKCKRTQEQVVVSQPLKRIHRVGANIPEPMPIEEEREEVLVYVPPPGPVEHIPERFKEAIGNSLFAKLFMLYLHS
jgi:hypothetical protein